MRAQNDLRGQQLSVIASPAAADTGGFRFMPCRLAEARPFAFKPPVRVFAFLALPRRSLSHYVSPDALSISIRVLRPASAARRLASRLAACLLNGFDFLFGFFLSQNAFLFFGTTSLTQCDSDSLLLRFDDRAAFTGVQGASLVFAHHLAEPSFVLLISFSFDLHSVVLNVSCRQHHVKNPSGTRSGTPLTNL
jgi:hypothetical protein